MPLSFFIMIINMILLLFGVVILIISTIKNNDDAFFLPFMIFAIVIILSLISQSLYIGEYTTEIENKDFNMEGYVTYINYNTNEIELDNNTLYTLYDGSNYITDIDIINIQINTHYKFLILNNKIYKFEESIIERGDGKQ